MAGLASINIKFAADLVQFSSSMQNANRKITSMGKNLQKVGAGLSVGVTAPFVAFSSVALKNWDKQEQAIAQVNAGLNSTGNAVGYTSEQLQSMASALQNNSLFGDEEILQNATAQLLTFTNIAGEQFGRTQQAAIDLSTRLGGDLKSASIQLGKALNDPVANLSALSRSGIQFSKDQKEVINSLVATNRLADAQTIILDELEKQYGGAGAAAAKAGLGPFKQLQNTIGDVKEEFGAIIAEAIIPFVDKIKGVVSSFQNLSKESKTQILLFGSIAAAIGPVLVGLGFLMTTVVPGLSVAFTSLNAVLLANPIGIIVTAVAALSATVVLASSNLGGLTNATEEWVSVSKKATEAVAEEKTALERNLAIARDEKRSKEDRLSAIDSLKKTYPDYLGFLDLETVNTDKTKTATDNLVLSLLQKAKVMAAQDKLVQVQKQLLDLQLGQNDAIKPTLWQNLASSLKGFGSVAATQLNISKSIAANYSEEETALNSLQDRLISFLSDNKELVDTLKNTAKAGAGLNNVLKPKSTTRKVATVLDVTAKGPSLNVSEGLEKEHQEIDENLAGINSSFIDFSNESSQIITGAATNVLAGFGSMIAGLASGSLTMGDVAGGLMQTIGDLAVQLGKAAIEIGVGMLAVKAAFANPLTAIAAGVGLVAIGTLIASTASITSGDSGGYAGAFADGGIVGGTSFSGDKLFARINSGEMVLNKRQQRNVAGLIGSGASAQAVNVTLQPSIDFVGDKFRVMLNKVDSKNARKR